MEVLSAGKLMSPPVKQFFHGSSTVPNETTRTARETLKRVREETLAKHSAELTLVCGGTRAGNEEYKNLNAVCAVDTFSVVDVHGGIRASRRSEPYARTKDAPLLFATSSKEAYAKFKDYASTSETYQALLRERVLPRYWPIGDAVSDGVCDCMDKEDSRKWAIDASEEALDSVRQEVCVKCFCKALFPTDVRGFRRPLGVFGDHVAQVPEKQLKLYKNAGHERVRYWGKDLIGTSPGSPPEGPSYVFALLEVSPLFDPAVCVDRQKGEAGVQLTIGKETLRSALSNATRSPCVAYASARAIRTGPMGPERFGKTTRRVVRIITDRDVDLHPIPRAGVSASLDTIFRAGKSDTRALHTGAPLRSPPIAPPTAAPRERLEP